MSAGRPWVAGPVGRGDVGCQGSAVPAGPHSWGAVRPGVSRLFLSSLGPQSSFLPLCSEHQLSIHADCGTQISWVPLQE